MQTFLEVGPLIGGAILLVLCGVNILRNPQISNANAGLLALGAVLFAVPTWSTFQLSGPGLQLSAQNIGKQLTVQGANTNGGISDIKAALAAIANRLNTVAPTVAQGASPKKVVLVFFVENQLTMALEVQNFLLSKNYAANVALTDFGEVKDTARGQPGTARLIYISQLQGDAEQLITQLKAKFNRIQWSNSPSARLSAANMEIEIF